jgi:hypothetical protein
MLRVEVPLFIDGHTQKCSEACSEHISSSIQPLQGAVGRAGQ